MDKRRPMAVYIPCLQGPTPNADLFDMIELRKQQQIERVDMNHSRERHTADESRERRACEGKAKRPLESGPNMRS